MAQRRIQETTWQRLTKDGTPAELLGMSPGGVAAELGISRQAVHDAIRRGRLDAVAVYRGVKLLFNIIPTNSVVGYREHLQQRALQRVKELDTLRRRA